MKLKDLKNGEIFTVNFSLTSTEVYEETNGWNWVKISNNEDSSEFPNCCTCRRLESNKTRLNESLLVFKSRPIITQFDKNIDVKIKK